MTNAVETQVLEVQYNEEQLKIISESRHKFLGQIKDIEASVLTNDVYKEQSTDTVVADRVHDAMVSVVELIDKDYMLVPKEEDLMLMPASTSAFVDTNASIAYTVGLDISGGLAQMYAEINS